MKALTCSILALLSGLGHARPLTAAAVRTEPHITLFKTVGSTLFAGTFGNGLLRSSDRGETWSYSNGDKDLAGVMGLAQVGDALFLASTSYMYRSEDAGISWAKMNIISSPNRYEVRALAADSGILIASIEQSPLGRSADSGKTWSREGMTFGNNPFSVVDDFLVAGGAIYAGTASRIMKSVDKGLTWSDVSLFQKNPDKDFVHSLVWHHDALYAGIGGALFRSPGGDGNWTLLHSWDAADRILSLAFSGDTMLAGTMTEGIWRSSGSDTVWSQVRANDGIVWALESVGASVFAGVDQGVGILRSDDGGKTWAPKNTGVVGLHTPAPGARKKSPHAGQAGYRRFRADGRVRIFHPMP